MIAAIAGLLIASSSPARAANTSACCSGSCCHDGIAASPKLRATLDERCLSQCTAPAHPTVSTITPQTAWPASPKVRQMNHQNTPAAVIQVAPETAGYQATGSDGITASPKLRAMLNERSQEVQIAPLK